MGRDDFVGEREAVEEDDGFGDPKEAGVLVHEAAVDAGEAVFGFLGDEGEVLSGKGAAAKLLEQQGKAGAERCRRGEARAHWDGAAKGQVQGRDGYPPAFKGIDDAQEVVGPCVWAWSTQRRRLLGFRKVNSQPMVGGTSARGKGHVAVDGGGEDPAVVVVDVLAEEVDSARG